MTEEILMPVEDVRKLDAIIHKLGIEDSSEDPCEAIDRLILSASQARSAEYVAPSNLIEACDCGSVSDGPWAGIHSKNCATALVKGKFRMHDMEDCVIVKVGADGMGGEFCNTLNSFGDQRANARFILDAIRAFQESSTP